MARCGDRGWILASGSECAVSEQAPRCGSRRRLDHATQEGRGGRVSHSNMGRRGYGAVDRPGFESSTTYITRCRELSMLTIHAYQIVEALESLPKQAATILTVYP